ncbi:MAG: hypothetical protein Q9157_004673 [Trypethelium eluteriae]
MNGLSQPQALQQSDGSSFTLGPDYIDYGGYYYALSTIISKTILVTSDGNDTTLAPRDVSQSLESTEEAAMTWVAGQRLDADSSKLVPPDPEGRFAVELEDISQKTDSISPGMVNDIEELDSKAVDAFVNTQITTWQAFSSFKDITLNTPFLRN